MRYNCVTTKNEEMKKESKTTLNLRIDSDLKNEAEKVIEEIGLSTSAAIVLFFKALVRCEGLPFEVKVKKQKEKEVSKNLVKKQTTNNRLTKKSKKKTLAHSKEDSLLKAIENL